MCLCPNHLACRTGSTRLQEQLQVVTRQQTRQLPLYPTFVLDINSDIQRVLRGLDSQPVFDADKQLVDEAAYKACSTLQLGKEALAEILTRSFVAKSRQMKNAERAAERC
jgi:hypothetical protein